MWQVFIFVGAARLIQSWLSETAAEERQRWEDEREQFERDIKHYSALIQEVIKSRSYEHPDFHELVNLHYASFRTADQAKKLLDDSDISIKAINDALRKAKLKRDSLKINIKAQHYAERIEINKEIQSLIELRKSLFDTRDELLEQRSKFFNKLKNLNSQTHQLKEIIRDNTGYKGEEWYDRLQERRSKGRY